MKRIDCFRLEYDYLSSFYPALVTIEGLEYLSVEAASGPAALPVHIVRYVSQRENAGLKGAVLNGLTAMKALFPDPFHNE